MTILPFSIGRYWHEDRLLHHVVLMLGTGRGVQQGRLEWTMRNQGPGNQRDIKPFESPALPLVLKAVADGNVINWKPLPKVESFVDDLLMRSSVMASVRCSLLAPPREAVSGGE